jgi:gamma-glutamyltranspeptidase/glutathione hydrolase
MVATTDRYASGVGLDVLERGGNAVDAAVAVAFALAVVNPEAGNLGGGGFMLLRTADASAFALDYRSCAPGRATRDMFLDAHGNLDERSVIGHLAAGVPGSVRGMWEAHGRFGTLDWEELVEPALALARGFEVRNRFVRSFEPHIVTALARFPASAEIFLPGGVPPRIGDTFYQADLARTLERIRDRGSDGFYQGDTAEMIVTEMKRGGGIMDREDLAGYRAVWRDPVRFPYRGHTVLSMPPSSSGGTTLALAGGILDTFSVTDLQWHGSAHIHVLAEAWKRAFADRNHYLADPDFSPVPMDILTSPKYGAARARSIASDAATRASEVEPGVESFRESAHTTHFSVVDAYGNAASVTTTLNTWYGSKVVVPGSGVLLNNEMDDFSAKPGSPNFFGLVQGEANAIEPGKRSLSAMTPTIVLDGRGDLLMVVGAPGGATIITTVFQIISNVVDHGMSLSQAVVAPRVHHQHVPDEIRHEPGGLPAEVAEALRGLGHSVVEHDELFADAQAILVQENGTLHGVSDPRRGGVALGGG